MAQCEAVGTSTEDCDIEIHCDGFATHEYDGARLCTKCCREMLDEETCEVEDLEPLAGICHFCGATAEGNHAIERDGFDDGSPNVDLCDAHGSGELPNCEQIWERISLTRKAG